MFTAHANVIMPTPARYMVRLCNHFAHRVTVHREGDRARIEFPDAPCSLHAQAATLDMRIEAGDAAALERLKGVVAKHLKQVAAKEAFEINWTDS